jgi:hypothetical protein
MLRNMLLLLVLIAVSLSACSRRSRRRPARSGGHGGRGRPARCGAGAAAAGLPCAGPGGGRRRWRRRSEEARASGGARGAGPFRLRRLEPRADAQEVLARKVPLLRANPDVRLRIEGHADERGSVEYNLALGMRRANAVRDYLAGFGICCRALRHDQYGRGHAAGPGQQRSGLGAQPSRRVHVRRRLNTHDAGV